MQDFGKKEAIKINLKKLKISFDSFSNDYFYCGNNSDRREYYFKIFNNYDFPIYEDKCLCNTKIKKNSYIYNKKTKHILILGSCCIKKFCKNGIKKTCELCNEPHRNKLKNRCNKCKLIKIYSGFCTDCDKKIDTKYMKCFQCFNKKNTLII